MKYCALNNVNNLCGKQICCHECKKKCEIRCKDNLKDCKWAEEKEEQDNERT